MSHLAGATSGSVDTPVDRGNLSVRFALGATGLEGNDSFLNPCHMPLNTVFQEQSLNLSTHLSTQHYSVSVHYKDTYAMLCLRKKGVHAKSFISSYFTILYRLISNNYSPQCMTLRFSVSSHRINFGDSLNIFLPQNL